MNTQIPRLIANPAVLSIVALSLLAVCTRALSNRLLLLWKPLPPGPSLLSRWWPRPKNESVITRFMRWADTHGDIISVMDLVHLGETTIVLSSPKAATDLLNKRGGIYSSRPRNVIAGEIGYRGFKGTLQPTGPKYRKFRTLMHATVNAGASRVFRSLEDAESRLLLCELLLEESPEKYRSYMQRAVHSVAFYTAYGLRINRLDSDHIKFYGNLEKFLVENIFPGRHLVDHFPFLLYLPRPLQWFRKVAEEQGSSEEQFFLRCLSKTRAVAEKGLSTDVFAARILEKQESYGYSDAHVAIMSSTPYTAGVVTTLGMFELFPLAMLLYPDVMKQAQSDIDAVVGPNRLPGFGDLDSLPYILAIIKELGRWHPPAPLSLPHATSEDDIYEGMFIPAGSTVIANVYAITRNTEFFPDPEEFKPERFTNDTDPFFKNYNMTFGFGRRICPGQHVANDQLYTFITRILWAFDIVPEEDGFDHLKYRIPKRPRLGPPQSLPYRLVPRRDSVRPIILEAGLLAEEEVKAWDTFSFK